MVIKWWKKSTLTISQTWQHCSRRLIPEQGTTVTVVGLLCRMAHLLMVILQVKYQLDRRKQYILYPCIKPGTLLYCDTLALATVELIWCLQNNYTKESEVRNSLQYANFKPYTLHG